MINIVVYQGHHIVGIALAVAVNAWRWRGRLRFITPGQQDNEQHGGNSRSGDCNTPSEATAPLMFVHATLRIRLMYLFYQLVCIHLSFNLRSFSLMRLTRVVTLVWLMPSRRPISSEEKPSR